MFSIFKKIENFPKILYFYLVDFWGRFGSHFGVVFESFSGRFEMVFESFLGSILA